MPVCGLMQIVGCGELDCHSAFVQVLYKGPAGHDAHDSFTLMMDNGTKLEVPCHALQPRSKVLLRTHPHVQLFLHCSDNVVLCVIHAKRAHLLGLALLPIQHDTHGFCLSSSLMVSSSVSTSYIFSLLFAVQHLVGPRKLAAGLILHNSISGSHHSRISRKQQLELSRLCFAVESEGGLGSRICTSRCSRAAFTAAH